MTQLTIEPKDFSAFPKAKSTKGAFGVYIYTIAQIVSNVGFVFGALILPLLMYYMFGYGKEYSSISVGNGNVQSTILVMMTNYGVISTAAMLGCSTTSERRSGWWRTLALTPFRIRTYLFVYLAATLTVCMVLNIFMFVVGIFSGSQLSMEAWLSCFVLIQVSSLLPGAFGLALGQLLSQSSSFSLTSITLVVSAFLSGMFIPLDQMGEFMQKIAVGSPLYGIVNLVSSPIYGWEKHFEYDWVINIVAWTIAMLIFAAWSVTRPSRTSR